MPRKPLRRCRQCGERFWPSEKNKRQTLCSVRCAALNAQRASVVANVRKRLERERARRKVRAMRLFGQAAHPPSVTKVALLRRALNLRIRALRANDQVGVALADEALREIRNEVA